MTLPEPKKYDVFWSYFPYPNLEPNEIHPALVLQYYHGEDLSYVMVAGGSTLKADLKQNQFAIYKEDNFFNINMPGLYNDTKFTFNLNTLIILPYNNEHFAFKYCKNRNLKTSFCGNIPIYNQKYPYLKTRFDTCKKNIHLEYLMKKVYDDFFE